MSYFQKLRCVSTTAHGMQHSSSSQVNECFGTHHSVIKRVIQSMHVYNQQKHCRCMSFLNTWVMGPWGCASQTIEMLRTCRPVIIGSWYCASTLFEMCPDITTPGKTMQWLQVTVVRYRQLLGRCNKIAI